MPSFSTSPIWGQRKLLLVGGLCLMLLSCSREDNVQQRGQQEGENSDSLAAHALNITVAEAVDNGTDSSTDSSTNSSTNTGDNGGGGAGTGTSTETGGEVIANPSPSEISLCAKATGVSSSMVKIAGNQHDMQLDIASYKAIAVKVTGNLNHLRLVLQSEAGKSLAGLCLFAAGNQSQIDVMVDTNIDVIAHWARGNQTKTSIVVNEGFSVQQLSSDIKGNKSVLLISGKGSYPTSN